MRSALALVLLLLASGCAMMPQSPAPTAASGWTGPAFGANPVEEALRYHVYIKKLPNAELVKEYEGVRQAFERRHDDFSRIQYALLLSLPKAPFSDDNRALKLLEGWQRDDSSGLRRFGAFLSAQLAEEKRLEESIDALRAKLKDEQRRADDAEAKLNALKSIERSMQQRHRTP